MIERRARLYLIPIDLAGTAVARNAMTVCLPPYATANPTATAEVLAAVRCLITIFFYVRVRLYRLRETIEDAAVWSALVVRSIHQLAASRVSR